MKNKKLWITVLFSVVCIAVILTVILLANNQRKDADTIPNDADSFASLKEAEEYAQFPLRTTDRLNGELVTEYFADETAITVTFGDAGYVTKIMLIDDVSGTSVTDKKPDKESNDASEVRTEHEIGGVTVLFTGENDAVTKAEWTDNGFDYAIVLTENSVTADMMTDDVSATR